MGQHVKTFLVAVAAAAVGTFLVIKINEQLNKAKLMPPPVVPLAPAK